MDVWFVLQQLGLVTPLQLSFNPQLVFRRWQVYRNTVYRKTVYRKTVYRTTVYRKTGQPGGSASVWPVPPLTLSLSLSGSYLSDLASDNKLLVLRLSGLWLLDQHHLSVSFFHLINDNTMI